VASELKRQFDTDGFCVIENVIPADKIDDVRKQVVQVQSEHAADSEEEMKKTRSRGHRIGNKGVGNLRQVINHTQSFAPYLADRRIMDLAEDLFGSYVRISCTDCVINYPGNDRGYWHADWPFNQTNASHVVAPYPDVTMHLSTIWMLTSFTAENGGTLAIPGSHRSARNPSGGDMEEVDRDAPYPTEMHVTGPAGSVFVGDSRLWHSVATNLSDAPRVAMIVRYAPWWLNLNPTMIGTPEHTQMVVETGGKNYEMELIRPDVYEKLPDNVKPLYRYCVG
jgi:ectoine hydroxylase-related dioxygenase (phytanoyl-CoA dioxygenase family)